MPLNVGAAATGAQARAARTGAARLRSSPAAAGEESYSLPNAESGKEADRLPPEWLNVNLAPLYRQLERLEAAQAGPVIEEYLLPLTELMNGSLLMTGYVVMDIKLAASRILSQCGAKPADVLPDLLSWNDVLRYGNNARGIVEYAVTLLTMSLEYRDRHAARPCNDAIRGACAYMEAHYQRKELTLRDTARHVSLSNNHFCTLFRREMGMSFVDYLTKLRMEKAMEYLRNTGLGSADIAERVGYTDPSYFRTLFKRFTGMSPRAYRTAKK